METVREVPPSGEPIPDPPSGDFPYPRRRGKKKTGASPSPEAEGSKAPESAPVLTQDQLEKTVIGSMSLLAALFDESYAVLDDKQQPLPHVSVACAQMLPWFQIYGGYLVKAMPWFGLATGALMLLGPAIDPTVEIAMGVRKMRFTRRSPDDVYSDRYKAARAASQQTVEMTRGTK